MAVNLTNLDISTRYALQEDFNNGFVGRDRQIVIQTDDAKGYRPIIMDGKTSGGKNKVALLDDLENFNADTATKLKTTRNLKVNLASTANDQFDGSGDATAIGVSGTLPIANGGTGRTDGHAPKDILMSGSRGKLLGYETVTSLSGSQTITKNSADTITMSTTGAVKLTFTAAGSTECAVKVISLTASGTTTLTISGAVWANGGDAPAWGTAGKHLVLVANFVGGRVILGVFDNDEG